MRVLETRFDSGAGDDDDAMIVICPKAAISRAPWFEFVCAFGQAQYALSRTFSSTPHDVRPKAKYTCAVDVSTNESVG